MITNITYQISCKPGYMYHAGRLAIYTCGKGSIRLQVSNFGYVNSLPVDSFLNILVRRPLPHV